MSIVQPAPIRTGIADQNSLISQPWGQFFFNIYNVLRGKVDIAKTLTLTAGTTTTTINDNFCQTGSHVFVTAVTAHAAASTGVYIVTAKGSFTVHHNSTADTDKTFSYAIVG